MKKKSRLSKPKSPSAGLATRKDFQATTYWLSSRNDEPSLEGKFYPPSYTIPAIDEIYMEWENENGELESGNRIIRYVPGEQSIFADEQSEQANNTKRLGRIEFVEGRLVVQGIEKLKKQYLDLCSWNSKNVEFRMPGKSTIFFEEDLPKTAEELLDQKRVLYTIQGLIFEQSEEELRALAMTFDIRGYDTRSTNELRKELLEYAEYNPANFKEEYESEERKRKYWIMRGLEEGVFDFNEQEHVYSVIPGGEQQILAVPRWANPIDFFAEASLTKESVKEVVDDMIKYMKNPLPTTKKKVVEDEDFPIFNQGIEYKIIIRKGPWFNFKNKNIGRSTKEAIDYIKNNEEVKKQLEEAVEAYEANVMSKG